MGRETILFKSEEKRDIRSVAAFLRELADKVEQQRVVLKQEKKTVKLKLPAVVELEIKAEREDGRRKSKKKLEIEIEWVVGAEKKATDRSVKLG
jgi:amphi-Trp domain-containing protein